MIKQEINEIKKRFTSTGCTFTRICGLYVDGEKNRKTEFKQAFLSLPEEEIFKYLEFFKKSLSGTTGKNLFTLNFPLAAENPGSVQDLLLRLRDSGLKDDILLEEFYNKVIDNYEYVGNYLILLVHDVYDIPGKTTDGLTMEDASDEVYDYILACICPVNLSKPGLSYIADENAFHNRIRDWVVEQPDVGFLFPAFHDRSADIHSLLYYSKDAENIREDFVDKLFACEVPTTAGTQKETFRTMISETLGEECDIETVLNIHERLNEMIEERSEDPEPLVLDRNEFKTLLADSGVSNEKLDVLERRYEAAPEEEINILAKNVASSRTFEVKTPDVVIKVDPARTDLLTTRRIDGRDCLVIALDNSVQVNGVTVRAMAPEEPEE